MGKKFDENTLKVNLKLAISRLKLQKQKKSNNVINQKREIADLLRAGKDESARIKVEGIIREDFLIEAYDIVELFCELALARLGVIQVSKQCPEDIKEAIATLIYAAPRIEVKELAIIREQLVMKFGKEFGMEAMNNKDNMVNARIVHKLSVMTPENYLVYQYLNEIAKSNNLDWSVQYDPPPPSHTITAENYGHPKVDIPLGASIVSSGPPISSSFPLFPEPPSHIGGSGSGSGGIPAFPSVPGSFSSSPSPSMDFPQIPEPSFPVVPTPTFNFNTLRGNNPEPVNFPVFPDVPTPSINTATSNNIPSMPSFPSPPTSTNNKKDIDFPSVPQFPTVPMSPNSTIRANSNTTTTTTINNDIFPSFPTPPTTSDSNNNIANLFPSPPTNTIRHDTTTTTTTSNTLVFPTPPTGNTTSNDVPLPDFDELTARFEKLKKKNM